jgi:pimeloyl-ACP methyl ester carboxylesterase
MTGSPEPVAPPPPPITCSQLGQIEVPVTIARGELTRSFYRIAAATAHRCIPESQLVILPGGRHMAPTEHPSAFNEVLLDSLEQQLRR